MPAQPPMPQPGNQAKTVSSVNEESDDRILGKRSIDELFQQVSTDLSLISQPWDSILRINRITDYYSHSRGLILT